MSESRAVVPAQIGHHPHDAHGPGTTHDRPITLTRGAVLPQHKPEDVDNSPIELIDDLVQDAPSKKIRAFGAGEHLHQKEYKRPTFSNQTGAVRVKTFHGKLSDQGMDYLDNAVNDWLEAHPGFEVKFVTSAVGMFDGKIKEPALMLNVWY